MELGMGPVRMLSCRKLGALSSRVKGKGVFLQLHQVEEFPDLLGYWTPQLVVVQEAVVCTVRGGATKA